MLVVLVGAAANVGLVSDIRSGEQRLYSVDHSQRLGLSNWVFFGLELGTNLHWFVPE